MPQKKKTPAKKATPRKPFDADAAAKKLAALAGRANGVTRAEAKERLSLTDYQFVSALKKAKADHNVKGERGCQAAYHLAK